MQTKEKDSTTTSSTGKCPECGGGGLIAIWKSTPRSRSLYGDDRELCFAEPCPKCNGAKANRLFQIKERANVPNCFYDKKLDFFKWDEYVDDKGNSIDLSTPKAYVESFISDFEKWSEKGLGFYIVTRRKGTGKTLLASCICNEIMDKYPVVTKFVNVADLLDLANKQTEGGKDPIEVLCECKLLVLDDIGQKNTGKEWLNDLLFKIIDSRYQHKLVTIVTSNVQLKDLNLDDRVVSRLFKMCQKLALPEYSIRQSEAKDERIDFFKELGLMKGE